MVFINQLVVYKQVALGNIYKHHGTYKQVTLLILWSSLSLFFPPDLPVFQAIPFGHCKWC